MREKTRISLLRAALPLIFAPMALAGCAVTARNSAQVRPPAGAPQPTVAAGTLPFPAKTPDISALQSEPQPAVDVLIAEVRASFAAGQKAHQNGKLSEAREDFNSAVNRIMKSGVELGAGPQLEQLFNQIVDTMHSYELEAEQMDEAEAQQGEEPGAAPAEEESTAPIEEIASLENLPATDPLLAATAKREILTVPHDLPLTVNDSVLQYLSFFASPRGREIVEGGLERGGQYREMIEAILKKEGLPQDLIYLAQAESAFKARAHSRMGAGGIWQFIPFTGEEYGLYRNYWVDERNDPVAATRAAAEHLRDLYNIFGDWYLAMAAYNSGRLNVARAVERTGYADFWKLQQLNALPAQTKNYVPIILALALVAKDPALYGIQVDPEPPLRYDTVQPVHSLSLRLVADATGATFDDIEQLNPELIRGITPNDPDFQLRVPVGTGPALRKQLALIPPEKWTTWRLDKVSPGETIGEIARRYHVSVASIENVNVLDRHEALVPGTELIIPARPPRYRLVHYRVRPGDTLGSIAARFDVSVWDVRRWNRLRGSRAPRGRWLRIYEASYTAEGPARRRAFSRDAAGRPGRTSAVAASSNARVIEHRVQRGETLWSIARAYRTTVAALKRANPSLAGTELEAGEILIILPVR